jgi:hypothetical protein
MVLWRLLVSSHVEYRGEPLQHFQLNAKTVPGFLNPLQKSAPNHIADERTCTNQGDKTWLDMINYRVYEIGEDAVLFQTRLRRSGSDQLVLFDGVYTNRPFLSSKPT